MPKKFACAAPCSPKRTLLRRQATCPATRNKRIQRARLKFQCPHSTAHHNHGRSLPPPQPQPWWWWTLALLLWLVNAGWMPRHSGTTTMSKSISGAGLTAWSQGGQTADSCIDKDLMQTLSKCLNGNMILQPHHRQQVAKASRRPRALRCRIIRKCSKKALLHHSPAAH